MKIIIEGQEEIIKALDKIAELTDELKSAVFKLGGVYGCFKEEETASAETEAEERD